MPEYDYTFTVFTPTYNRADTLHRGYESLLTQPYKDFEWLIIDDGSTDCTPELVADWQRKASFPIHYIWKENGGRHSAINRGVEAARGRFFLFLDSDDAYTPNALARYKYHWDTIPDDKKDQFSAVTALAQDPQGRLVGSRFPFDPTDSDSIEIRYKYKVSGEKRGFQRTDVLRQYPIPTFEEEKTGIDSVLWNKIALKYKTRYVNEVLAVYYITPNHMGSHRFLARALNPHTSRNYYRELVSSGYPLSHQVLLREYANYVRYSLHAGIRFRQQLQQIPSPAYCLIAWPVGCGVYLLDRKDLRTKARQQTPRQESG